MTTFADPTLDLEPLTVPTYEPELSLAGRFAAFDAANPHVFAHLERMTRDWLSAGHKRASIAQFFEVLRHQSGLSTSGDVWRLNNSWRAFYVRRLIAEHPEWADAFETREQRASP